MKKIIFALSALSLTVNSAWSEELGVIEVEGTRLSDVSGDEVKSADLAEALAKKLPSVSIVRRSGIANDIILRGQKKDNINILVDNAKVYGACPNRMDPPTSHVLTNTIDSIDVIAGPYDVENFGTLSGAVNITTRKPSKVFKGEISLNLGSYDYRKVATTISGGGDSVRFLLGVSTESSAQYEDGDGNDFYEQIASLNLAAPVGVQYKDEFKNTDAYEKSAVLGKVFIDVTDNQELRLSYTANRSDDVLYPSSKMDALYDDSNIFNLGYAISDSGKYSKMLDIQYYNSEVEHPMSTFYRNSSGVASVNEKTSFLTTEMQGLKVKNTFDLSSSSEMTVGVDSSVRNWDGTYSGKGSQAAITGLKSIPDVDTENNAVFVEVEKKYSDIKVKAGARYDDTHIEPSASSGMASNDYTGLSANVFASYDFDKTTRYFGGVGRAERVPDARELYFRGAMTMGSMAMNPLLGTPTLEETSNTEIDLGVEKTYDNFNIKTRLFYSWLKDYIYFNADKLVAAGLVKNVFENIDARIYGLEVSGYYFINDKVNIDYGVAYQQAQKDHALDGQTNTNLAEVLPLKGNLTFNYDYSRQNTASVELVAAGDWNEFDDENGEQVLSGYGVINMKVKHDITRAIELTAGIDNVFDKTYITTNTYKDLTLLFDGTGDVMLINEPGRYLYVNGTYRF